MMDQKARKLAHFDPHFPHKSWRCVNFNGLWRWNGNEKYYRLISIYIFDPVPPLSPYRRLTNPVADAEMTTILRTGLLKKCKTQNQKM